MHDQPKFFQRIGRMFGSNGTNGNGQHAAEMPTLDPLEADPGSVDELPEGGEETAQAVTAVIHPEIHRGTFLRPWAKRDAAITQLQEGFGTLGELMTGVKESLDRQTAQQGELMRVLSVLPEALAGIPQNSVAQTETLGAIADQIRQQNARQAQLGNVLEKLAQTGGGQQEVLASLHGHVETLGGPGGAIAGQLNQVGEALQGVSDNARVGTDVLIQFRDHMNRREGEIQRIVKKQGVRYLVMLAVTVVLSVAAVAAAGAAGYVVLHRVR